MQTAIETIQKAIYAEKHNLINHFEIRDKLISQLSDNNSSQIHCQQKIENLERELKEICGNFYPGKDTCNEEPTLNYKSGANTDCDIRELLKKKD